MMLDDSVVLILMVSDTTTMRFRFLHACVCFNQAPGKRRSYFYSTLSQKIGANLFVFFHLFVLLWFAMFCKEYLCMKKTKKKNTFNVREVCGNYLVQSTKNDLYCTLKA